MSTQSDKDNGPKVNFREGVILGPYMRGRSALPRYRKNVVLPRPELPKHVLVTGSPGMGKSWTSLFLAFQIALMDNTQVLYWDGKGDLENAQRFLALMRLARRDARIFPNEPINIWRGDWSVISNHMLDAITFATSGPASYYRETAKLAIQLICRHPDGPPRSSQEFIDRFNLLVLRSVYESIPEIQVIEEKELNDNLKRYLAFFGQIGTVLDGDWSYEDVEAAYLLTNSAVLREETDALTRMLFSDFVDYFERRKDPETLCVMFVDEFTAIAHYKDLALLLEQARSFNTSMVLIPQTLAGIGDIAMVRRIIGATKTKIMHAHPEPEELSRLAGQMKVPDLTYRLDENFETEGGLLRMIEVPRIDPEDIRNMGVGTAWVIFGSSAFKVQMKTAPHVELEPLPAAADILRPLKERRRPIGRRPSYGQGAKGGAPSDPDERRIWQNSETKKANFDYLRNLDN